MRVVWQVISLLLFLFLVMLIARLVLVYVRMFARSWRPQGLVLVAAEMVYTVTDPPLRMVRRIIPPLTIGGLRIDLAFIVLFLITSTLMGIRPV